NHAQYYTEYIWAFESLSGMILRRIERRRVSPWSDKPTVGRRRISLWSEVGLLNLRPSPASGRDWTGRSTIGRAEPELRPRLDRAERDRRSPSSGRDRGPVSESGG